MKLNFNVPDVENATCGVYAIIFDEEYAYIGSSKDIKKRFYQWVTLLRNGKTTNKNMADILKICSNIRFEIIEKIPYSYLQRVNTEQYYIQHGEDKGIYKNILNINDAPNPDIKKWWDSLPEIRKDGLFYFPCKREFFGKFTPKGSNYPIIK